MHQPTVIKIFDTLMHSLITDPKLWHTHARDIFLIGRCLPQNDGEPISAKWLPIAISSSMHQITQTTHHEDVFVVAVPRGELDALTSEKEIWEQRNNVFLHNPSDEISERSASHKVHVYHRIDDKDREASRRAISNPVVITATLALSDKQEESLAAKSISASAGAPSNRGVLAMQGNGCSRSSVSSVGHSSNVNYGLGIEASRQSSRSLSAVKGPAVVEVSDPLLECMSEMDTLRERLHIAEEANKDMEKRLNALANITLHHRDDLNKLFSIVKTHKAEQSSFQHSSNTISAESSRYHCGRSSLDQLDCCADITDLADRARACPDESLMPVDPADGEIVDDVILDGEIVDDVILDNEIVVDQPDCGEMSGLDLAEGSCGGELCEEDHEPYTPLETDRPE